MFRGAVAVVTGAGRGVGQLAAWRLAAGGAQVVAIDTDDAGLERTVRHAPMVHPARCDVAVRAEVEQLIGRVERETGPVGRVVNAAAVVSPGNLLADGAESVDRVTSVSFLGLVHLTMAVVPTMVQRRSGDVVHLVSPAGSTPAPAGAYRAAQAAVVSFSETLRGEIEGSGVRLCCVCPPFVRRASISRGDAAAGARPGRWPSRRATSPEEMIDAAEVALERGRLFAYPGRRAALAWRLRELSPLW